MEKYEKNTVCECVQHVLKLSHRQQPTTTNNTDLYDSTRALGLNGNKLCGLYCSSAC